MSSFMFSFLFLRGEKLNTRNAERFTPQVVTMAEGGAQDEPGVTVLLSLKSTPKTSA